MGVMSIYSRSCEKDSLIRSENIDIDIPGGLKTPERDWYPFVMTFHPGEDFGYYVGNDCSLTILYNFPAFVPKKGCSMLYDPDSKYYSSFYGAYLVKADDPDAPYGFETKDGEIIGLREKDVAKVASYDYQQLVLRDFGLNYKEAVFDFTVDDERSCGSYAGVDNWFAVDATLTTNGCAHVKDKFVQSYLQYGVPKYETDSPLAPVTMYGRIYGKYFPEKQTGVFFYIIAADKEVLQNCDEKLLSKSTLTL